MRFDKKRVFDVVVSSVALIAGAVPMAILGAAVYLTMGRPVIFQQERWGKGRAPFKIYKFRSMHDVKDKQGKMLSDDNRTPPLGAFMRKAALDELPQFWNVLKGQMSIVGPRPVPVTPINPGDDDVDDIILQVKPGMTSPATAEKVKRGCHLLPDERRRMDIVYVEQGPSVLGDLRILFQSAVGAIRGKNPYNYCDNTNYSNLATQKNSNDKAPSCD